MASEVNSAVFYLNFAFEGIALGCLLGTVVYVAIKKL